jgi:hypothetical protein
MIALTLLIPVAIVGGVVALGFVTNGRARPPHGDTVAHAEVAP